MHTIQSMFAFTATIFLVVFQSSIHIDAFTISTHSRQALNSFAGTKSTTKSTTTTSLLDSSSSGYIPPEQSKSVRNKRQAPEPKVGDIVRFYELDGGRADGQELIGKITFIQSSSSSKSNWLAEVTEMEDVGDGYFVEYPYRKRRKAKFFDVQELAPLAASYVRTEDAFKIPMDKMGKPMPSWDGYDLEGYEGPTRGAVNEETVQTDLQLYGQLKGQLLKNTAIAGVIGTIIAELTKGLDDALIYFAGAIAGTGYLFFLSIKTDTMGSEESKLGSNVSNLRFALPLLLLVGVAIQNVIAGDASPVLADGGSMNILRTVSPEQYCAAMLGFLTYRIPLFVSQLGPVIGDSAGLVLPGSAGIAMQMASEAKNATKGSEALKKTKNIFDKDLTTILLISGPAGTGKSELIERLIEQSEGKLIPPKRVDIIAEPILYEQLLAKDDILQVDESGRYALTKDGILSAARKPKDGEELDQVVVVDANVNLCRKLVNIGGTRLVGVWIGLDKLDKFESNLLKELDSGAIPIPEDETKESVLRAKKREIVKDIEYGVVSGIFEFTILNDDTDTSLLQLKSATNYCFE